MADPRPKCPFFNQFAEQIVSNRPTKQPSTEDILNILAQAIAQRKEADPESSYVASLFARGTDQMLKKIGEEATETVMAAKDLDNAAGATAQRADLVKETADLWFHTMVMLAHLGISHEEVLAELARRFGTSGHAEKAARTS